MKVLVIVARGCHLGYLGAYGNAWLATPSLDRLAVEGVVFDQHYADAPSPEGARRSWRGGRYHLDRGSRIEDRGSKVGDAAAVAGLDLFEICRQQRVATGWLTDPTADVIRQALVSANLLWLETTQLLPPWKLPLQLVQEHFADLADEEEEPLEPLLDPAIGPIDPDDDREHLRLQQTYALAVRCFDDWLGQLLESVDRDTLVILTADHGLPLGEHGIVGICRPWLHEELIHVPLIIRWPGAAPGRRVAALTQAIDLMPTLLDVLGLPIPANLHGHSLRPLCTGEAASLRDHAVCGLGLGDQAEWALRTPAWAYLLPGGPPRRPQLYVKPDDRWEVNDVIQHHLDFADQLEQILRALAEAVRQPGPLRPPSFH